MDLDARITALEAELAQLRREAGIAGPPDAAAEAEVTSRRQLLGRAGAALVGAAAGAIATASPAAANDPNDLTLGAAKTATALTQADYTGSGPGAAFLFQHGNDVAAGASVINAALAGWATAGSGVAGERSGVYGYTDVGGAAVYALNGGTGGSAVIAAHAGDGAGLWARSLSGPTLALQAGSSAPAMPATAGTWSAGDVVRTDDGHLWYCTGGGVGTASTWVRLSGGGLNLLATPQRAFDTRPGAGPFEGDDTRTVGLRPWGVPAGAKGALLNLTVTDTSGFGYLQVYSADLAAPPTTSNLNWYPGARIVANSATAAVSAAGEIKLTSQGGVAQVIVDVFGYYD